MTNAVRAGRTPTCITTCTASRNLSNGQNGGQAQLQQQQQEVGLSTLGTLFFGSLCASTFGLGVWQSQRYFEKIDQVEQRKVELSADPVELDRFTVVNEMIRRRRPLLLPVKPHVRVHRTED